MTTSKAQFERIGNLKAGDLLFTPRGKVGFVVVAEKIDPKHGSLDVALTILTDGRTWSSEHGSMSLTGWMRLSGEDNNSI